MDEPMSGLDIKYQIQVTSLIKEERDKRAAGCVMVMHDINLAAKTCDQIIELNAIDLYWIHPIYELIHLFIQGIFVLLNLINKPKKWSK